MSDYFDATSGAVEAAGLTDKDIVNLVFDWLPPLLAAESGETMPGKDVYEQLKNNPDVQCSKIEGSSYFQCGWKKRHNRWSNYVHFTIAQNGSHTYPAQIYLEDIELSKQQTGLGKIILGRLIKLATLLDYQYIGMTPVLHGSFVWLRLGARPVQWDGTLYEPIRERLALAELALRSSTHPSAARDAVWLGDLRHRYFIAKKDPVGILMELAHSDVMIGGDKIGFFVLGHQDVDLYLRYSVFDLHDQTTIARLQRKGVHDFSTPRPAPKDAVRPAAGTQAVTPPRREP